MTVRARLYEAFQVLDTSNSRDVFVPSASITVSVYQLGTTTPVTFSLYTTAEGSATTGPSSITVPSPFTLELFSEEPADVTLSITVGGTTTTRQSSFAFPSSETFNKYHPRLYGAAFDGIVRLNGTTASGSPSLTVPIGGDHTGFLAARDEGKSCVVIEVTGSGNTAVETNRFAGTILTVLSTTQVILSGNVSATLSGTARVIWGTDDSTAIQATIDAALAGSAVGRVYLPCGVAMLTAGLTFTGHTGGIVGEGGLLDANFLAPATLLVAATAGMTILRIVGNNLVCEGFSVDGAGKLAAIGVGLDGAGVHWSTFRQIRAAGCTDGFLLDYEHYGTAFYDCSAVRCTYGLRTQRTNGAAGVIQKVNFYNFSAEANVTAGVKIHQAQLISFFGGTMQTSPIGLQISGSADIHAFGVQFEGDTSIGVDFLATQDGAYSSIGSTVRSCWFTNCGTAVQAKGAYGLEVSGNHIDLCTYAGNFTDSGWLSPLNTYCTWGDNVLTSVTTNFQATEGLLWTYNRSLAGTGVRILAAGAGSGITGSLELRLLNAKAFANANARSTDITFTTINESAEEHRVSAKLSAEMTPATSVTFAPAELVAYITPTGAGLTELLRIKATSLVLKSGPQIAFGTGSPSAAVSAPVGSIYLRTDGTSGAAFYVKETGGSGNTGWVAK
jgi:hypothetical protein